MLYLPRSSVATVQHMYMVSKTAPSITFDEYDWCASN